MAAQTLAKRAALKAAVFLPLLSLLLCLASAPVHAAGATLTLNPATVNTATGQTFTVTIELDTGGNATDGTRAVLSFDKNTLSANKVTPGSIYPEYPQDKTKIDNTAGTINILGMDSSATHTGSGTFATIEFTAKAPGTANIALDFTPGSTHESNVADSATQTDILSAATGTTVSISGGSGGDTGGNTGGGTSGGGSSGSDTTKGGLPNTATVDPTLLLSAVGGAFIMFGAGMFIGAAKR